MEWLEQLVKRYRGKGLLVDSNLLLLLTVGSCRTGLISSFKRTQKYDLEAFGLLSRFMSQFQKHVTTPHVLTEVSNLATSLPEHVRGEYFSSLPAEFEPYCEEPVAFAHIRKIPAFVKFGITDSAISLISRNKYLVLTDDFALANFLRTQRQDVVNFSHLRQMAWELGER